MFHNFKSVSIIFACIIFMLSIFITGCGDCCCGDTAPPDMTLLLVEPDGSTQVKESEAFRAGVEPEHILLMKKSSHIKKI